MDSLKKFLTSYSDEDQANLKTVLVSNPVNLSPYALVSAAKIPEDLDQDEIRRRKKEALQDMLNDFRFTDDLCEDEPLSWASCILALLLCLPFFILIAAFVSYYGLPDLF